MSEDTKRDDKTPETRSTTVDYALRQQEYEVRCPQCRGQLLCFNEGLLCTSCKGLLLYTVMQRAVQMEERITKAGGDG